MLEPKNKNPERRIFLPPPTPDLNELYQHFIAHVTGYAIFTLDPSGKVSDWNLGAERIQGYTRQEVLGRYFSLFFSQEDVKKGLPELILQEAKRFGKHEEKGWRIRKDSTRFWVNSMIIAVNDAHGVLKGYVKIVHDLSEE